MELVEGVSAQYEQDVLLPDGVRRVLATGQAELKAQRDAENAKREAEEEVRRQAIEAAIAPARAAALEQVEGLGDLLAWVCWGERYVKADNLDTFNSLDVMVCPPGCVPIRFKMVREWEGKADGHWTPWTVYYGTFSVSRCSGGTTRFPVAVAMARETWLSGPRPDDDPIPY